MKDNVMMAAREITGAGNIEYSLSGGVELLDRCQRARSNGSGVDMTLEHFIPCHFDAQC